MAGSAWAACGGGAHLQAQRDEGVQPRDEHAPVQLDAKQNAERGGRAHDIAYGGAHHVSCPASSRPNGMKS